jgi:tRNA(Ile)-lysidine synthase
VALVDDLLARCTVPPPGTGVSCAVSGGADSTALLALACAAGCRPTAIHVDHVLREGSAEEADIVADLAASLGAEFRSERVVVEPGPNLEARARAARYSVLPDDVLTGHTADDQAETILLNLMRGAALDGLAGMRPERRPLLRLRRAETTALCAELGLVTVDDPSNRDRSFRRNRVRHELLPLLDDIAGRDVVAVLARQADLVREGADVVAASAASIDPTDARALAEAPPALARVAVRRWIAEATDLGHPVDSAAIARVLAVADMSAKAADLAEGWRVERTGGRLRLVLE